MYVTIGYIITTIGEFLIEKRKKVIGMLLIIILFTFTINIVNEIRMTESEKFYRDVKQIDQVEGANDTVEALKIAFTKAIEEDGQKVKEMALKIQSDGLDYTMLVLVLTTGDKYLGYFVDTPNIEELSKYLYAGKDPQTYGFNPNQIRDELSYYVEGNKIKRESL